MKNIINIWFVDMNWIMLLDNIYVDYYPCYDKAWSIVESEFLIWTSIYVMFCIKKIGNGNKALGGLKSGYN
jgi:hypothetical protein